MATEITDIFCSGFYRPNAKGFLSNTENQYASLSVTFKNIWDHLKWMEENGLTQEIARNNGVSKSSHFGLTPGTGFFYEENPFGNKAWSVFRFLPSANRDWSWYLYIEEASLEGSGLTGVNQPSLIRAASSGAGRGTGLSIAISVSGSISENPWGGTTGSLGSDTKGDPVWVSSSNDYNLYVFPVSNSPEGDHATSRQNNFQLTQIVTSNRPQDGNCIIYTDSDSFTFIYQDELENQHRIFYAGLYEPLTLENRIGEIDSNTVPFVVFFDRSPQATTPVPSQDRNFYSLTGLGSSPGNTDGGIVVPHGGNRIRPFKIFQDTTAILSDNANPQRFQGFFIEAPINLHLSDNLEAANRGLIGRMPNHYLRNTYGVYKFSTNTQRSRVALASGDRTTNPVGLTYLTMPWKRTEPFRIYSNRLSGTRFVITRQEIQEQDDGSVNS